MRLLPAGRSAVLVEVEDTAQATALYAAAREAGLAARDIVPGARSVLFDGVDPAALGEQLQSLPLAEARPVAAAREVQVPTAYDGPDLEATARLLGIGPERLVALHTSTVFTVAFCGFAPGFAYCTGLGRSVPRLDSPRPRVDPGSVGMAGEFTGIYPTASPGGWRIIGHTDLVLWDPSRREPALLSPGTTVRFVAR